MGLSWWNQESLNFNQSECPHLFSIISAYSRRRPVTSLGHQERRRVFGEGTKFFELCPIFSNYIQHIFPGGAKNFVGGASPPLVAGLNRRLDFSAPWDAPPLARAGVANGLLRHCQTYRRRQGVQKGHAPLQIFGKYSYFVLWEAFFKHNSVIRLKSSILAPTFFGPSQMFGLATTLARQVPSGGLAACRTF